MSKELLRLSDVVTASVGPDRSIPQGLIDIALRAMRRGSTRVHLGHQGLGFDFPAPIGWIMWIAPLDGGSRHHMISHFIGDDVDEHEIPEWLLDDAVETVELMESFLELFETGVSNGWSMSFERHQLEHENYWKLLAELNNTTSLGMRFTLEGTASNWGYAQAVPGSRASTSDTTSLSAHLHKEDKTVAFSIEGGVQRRVERAHVEERLRSTAPYFRPVAYNDPTTEEWVL